MKIANLIVRDTLNPPLHATGSSFQLSRMQGGNKKDSSEIFNQGMRINAKRETEEA